nr:hypothetical protein [Tanacetum cinerariifolium]
MTRSSTKELFTPLKDLERESRSSRKHFKTLSLDESRSPDFDLFSDQEKYSKEEVAETMELRTNTFSGLEHEDANEHIEKVPETPDLFHILNITINQVMLRAFPISLTRAASRWLRNKPSGSITTWEDLKTKFLSKYCLPARTAKKMEEINNFQQEPDENLYQAWERFKELLMNCPQHYLIKMQEVVLFYNGLDVQTRQILDSKGAIPSKTAADAKVAIQEMAEYSQKWHNGTSMTRSTKNSNGLAVIQVQLNNRGREIKKVNEKVYAAQVGCEQCKGASVSVMPLSTYLNLGLGELAHTKLTVELADRTVKYPKGIVENVLEKVDDLMPIIEEGEVIEEFRAKNDARMKIWMLIMMKEWAILFFEPFLREVGINATRFEGMITNYNGLRCKEIDEVGEISITWNPMCNCSHAGI